MMLKSNIRVIKAGSLGVLALVVAMFFVSWVQVNTISKPFKKKMAKEISQLWSENFELEDVRLSSVSKSQLSKFGAQGLYQINIDNQNVGFAVLAKAKSKFEYFDYMVFYDQHKNIKAVRILLYREDFGGEIGSRRWLRQFVGMNANSPIEVDNDIQGISGATISYLAITKGVKSLTQIISHLE